jgi:hypothetical protein
MKCAKSFLLMGVCAAAACLSACGSSAPASLVSVMLTQAPPAVLQVGATATLAATVTNDLASKGVDWTVTCGSSPCGSLNPTHTASGTSTTYTAPSPFLTNAPVTITAAATANGAKTASFQHYDYRAPGVECAVLGAMGRWPRARRERARGGAGPGAPARKLCVRSVRRAGTSGE